MKILFAVNNDNVSEAIVKKYQKEYKEILSYKNVYYFNAILRELQKDKSYSRIVISEDLEPFANNNYDSIDKFLFEKYSNISEEAKSINNDKIDIILICADRRKKTDNMLAKIYKKDIYNAIIGQDRSIDEVCKLIYRPRDKEGAKAYYGIQESELGETESENSVSEAEVENIRAHYARLGKNEDKYVESFNNIVAQYTDTQLKIIVKYLPINVKAVLEERSPKYQQLVVNSNVSGFDAKKNTVRYKEKIKEKEDFSDKEDGIVEQLIKPKTIKSVVIPTNLTTKNVQKVVVPKINKPEINITSVENIISKDIKPETTENIEKVEELNEISENEMIDKKEDTIIKTNEDKEIEMEVVEPKRGRGRPRKNPIPTVEEDKPKRGRGRPRKNPIPVIEENNIIDEKNQATEVDLFSIDNSDNKPATEVDLFSLDNSAKNEEAEIDLFNIEENDDKEKNEEIDLFSMDEQEEIEDNNEVDLFNIEDEEQEEIDLFNAPSEKETASNFEQEENISTKGIVQTAQGSSDFNRLLTADKKVVAFVGTTKNGTSFIVNNTAEMLSSMGIETAILDLTKTKNAYYIYTNNEEGLRDIARNCMVNLQNGRAEGIKINKNLTVYTEMPGEEKEYEIDKILETLLGRYSAVLIDTDFDTNPEVFEKVQEIYLVQTLDVLTIQPLTAFLRNLKSKNILQPEKLKIVINKFEKVRSLNVKTLIGGMSCYNSPNMTYMTELFNKDNIPYCEIPFEMQNYVKYLDSLVNCSITLNGYTKTLIASLKELCNMVYPLVNKQSYSQTYNKKDRRDPFSSQVNDTLNKMKKNY